MSTGNQSSNKLHCCIAGRVREYGGRRGGEGRKGIACAPNPFVSLGTTS